LLLIFIKLKEENILQRMNFKKFYDEAYHLMNMMIAFKKKLK